MRSRTVVLALVAILPAIGSAGPSPLGTGTAYAGDDPPPGAPPAPAPKPAPKPAAPPAPASAPVFTPGPGGMVLVPGGEVRIGTMPVELLKLVQGRKEVMLVVSYETPQHTATVESFFVDPWEVTNAQYAVFLEDSAKSKFKIGAVATLADLAKHLLQQAGDPTAEKDDVFWRHLFEVN